MASEVYLFDRFAGCFKAPPIAVPDSDLDCTPDKYKQLFRDRWKLIQQNPCDKLKFTGLNDACCDLDCSLKNCGKLCLNPGSWAHGQTLYSNDFKFPKSHNDVDDCCSAPCPCADGLPDYTSDSRNTGYLPTPQWTRPCPPMDSCTTYKNFFTPHEIGQRHCPDPETYYPCDCPMEKCTTTRADFTPKTPFPNGPSNAQVIKHGLWSCGQFCKDFADVTTNQLEYKRKCGGRPPAIMPRGNFIIPFYPLKSDTETGSEFTCKEGEPVGCYHPWLDNENWHKPETALDTCTTYKHFFKPNYFPSSSSCTVDSPGAIPFCSMNRLCYSCYDPVPNQKTPLELKDNDPWPYVKPCQIRYQDNLQADPCADFNDDTTYKHDYWPKAQCKPRESFAPIPGFVPAITPFSDDTTMKVSYPAYSRCQYKEAKTCAGNPCGIKYGLNRCPENGNKCLPRFPSPYGHPLKPYNCQHCRCPCGPFDNRSSYYNDFKFRSQTEIDEREEEMCRKVNVPLGISSYRCEFVQPTGKKAARMPPPISKGNRCLHPCNYQNLDTLNRVSFQDFWKIMSREEVDALRGRSGRCPKKNDRCEDYQDQGDEEPVIYQPILIRQPKKKSSQTPLPCTTPTPPCPPLDQMDQNLLQIPRCRAIPYSGRNIVNRARTSAVCDGHDGQ